MKKFNEIVIKFVDEDQQRLVNGEKYDTLGDYYVEEDVLHIDILKTDEQNHRVEPLIAIHELVEALLVINRNISIDKIDEFDMAYNKLHEEGEPGDEEDAPYHKEHVFATEIEKLMARELNVKWKDYN